ncbi:hypothetical protein D3C78_1124750 [compost metagenome]
MADQQVLRFTHQGADAAQCRAHSAMHQQAAQERPELVQVGMMQRRQVVVFIDANVLARVVARRHTVVHRIEPHGGADDHRGNGQCVKERRQKRREKAEHQGQHRLGTHTQKQAREQEQQQILHEVDPGHHEHQQQDDREVMQQLVVQRLGRGHAQHQGLDQQQPTRHQWVAFKGHGEGEDELQHQHPACDDRAQGPQCHGIEDQEGDDARLVPAR